MRVWVSGRESKLLEHIKSGHKNIEGRLNRDKFTSYKVGDIVLFRKDTRNSDGVLEDGEIDHSGHAEIISINHYKSFDDMFKNEDYKKAIPEAKDARDASGYYSKYYSIDDQMKYGVLAIKIIYRSNN